MEKQKLKTIWHYILEDILAIHYHKNLIGKCKVPVHTLKAYGGMKVQLNSFLTSELIGGECYLRAAAVLHSGGGGPGTH